MATAVSRRDVLNTSGGDGYEVYDTRKVTACVTVEYMERSMPIDRQAIPSAGTLTYCQYTTFEVEFSFTCEGNGCCAVAECGRPAKSPSTSERHPMRTVNERGCAIW